MLLADNVSFAYGDSPSSFRLADVTARVPRAGVFGILGPNGSGKTTLLKLLAGSLRPTRGRVLFGKEDVAAIPRRQLARRMAVVPQETRPAFDYSVLEIVLMGRFPHLGPFELEGPDDVAIAREAMAATGTLALEGRQFTTLSGGERQRVILASGDAVNGIYFNPQPVPIREDMPMVAYPGYYPLSKVIEEAMTGQFFHQAGVPTVILRMSWIHAEDDVLRHLTVAGEPFGVPVWRDLMTEQQRARFASGEDAAVALRHPDGRPMRRHVVAVEDCVQAHLLALEREGVQGQTFMIAMNEPFDYVETARYAAGKLGIGVLELVDTVGQDFCIDVAKARYVLGYRPQYDVFALVDRAIEFRRSGGTGRLRAGYRGTVLSRSPPRKPREETDSGFGCLWLSEGDSPGSLPPRPHRILQWVETLPRNHAILVDRLDYIISRSGPRAALELVHRLREAAYLGGHIVIFGLDPATVDSRWLRAFEKEASEVTPRQAFCLPPEQQEIVKHVFQQSIAGRRPTLTEAGRALGFSKPTVRRHVREAVRDGYVALIQRGRTKVLELTEKGRGVFSK